MLLLTSKNILRVSVTLIWGVMFVVNQPAMLLANDQVVYTPPIDRPEPQRTQGGGSRIKMQTDYAYAY